MDARGDTMDAVVLRPTKKVFAGSFMIVPTQAFTHTSGMSNSLEIRETEAARVIRGRQAFKTDSVVITPF